MKAASHIPFAAIVIPLVRSADMKQPEQEFEEFWRSLHDVTGNSILVACPAGRTYHSAGIVDLYEPVMAQPSNLHFTGPDSAKFTRIFWGNVRLGQERPHPPHNSSWRDIAWTTSTRQIAELFDLTERDLPTILIVDPRSHSVLSLQMHPELDVYDICKAIIERLGDAPRRIEESQRALSRARARLHEATRGLPDRNTLTKQFNAAATRLRHESIVSPAQIQCADLLDVAMNDARHLPFLVALLMQVREDSRSSLGHGSKLSRQMGRLVARIESLGDNAPIPGSVASDRVETARTDAQRERDRLHSAVQIGGIEKAITHLAREIHGGIRVLRSTMTPPLAVNGWSTLKLSPKEQGVASVVGRVSVRRRRAQTVFLLASLTTILTAVVAIFTNVVTGTPGFSWLWFVLGLLVIASAILAGFLAKSSSVN